MWDPNDDGTWRRPRGSFVEPVPPPATEVCDPPLYCLSVNQAWLPYLAGAAMQLCQPSTWQVDSESARDLALARATDLISEIGNAVPCTSTPYRPPGTGTDQAACNIAGYLANMVIRYAMNQAIQGVKNTLSELQFLLWIIRLITGIFPITSLVVSAFVQLYTTVLGGTLTNYQDAVGDDSLWAAVTCAIYTCIRADGDVTDANFPCVQAALCGLTYVHPEVVAAICAFVEQAGAQAFLQAQQPGVIASYTCTCTGGPPVTTGPGLPPADRAAGIARVLIAAGNAVGQLLVTFGQAFPGTPVITPGTDDPIMLPSIAAAAPGSFLAVVEAARPVDVDTFVDVDWIALPPGQV